MPICKMPSSSDSLLTLTQIWRAAISVLRATGSSFLKFMITACVVRTAHAHT